MADLIVSVPDNNCKACKFNPLGTVYCELFDVLLNTDEDGELIQHSRCSEDTGLLADLLEAVTLLHKVKDTASANPNQSKWSTTLRKYVGDLMNGEHYGRWGCLVPEQRKYLRNVAAYMDSQDTYIKQLQEEIAKLKTNWIPVTETTMPPKHKNVLCLLRNDYMQTGWVDCEGNFAYNIQPTHWCEQPILPEE